MTCTCSSNAAQTTPTQILKDEHRVIERVLDAAERQLQCTGIDRTFFEKTLDFCRNFADGCHHAKEEDELFPVMESAGVLREGGPIGCMLHEHEQGRALLRRVDQNLAVASEGDSSAADIVRQAMSAYILLLRQHIQKEDNVLFAMADQVLGIEKQRLMMEAFDRAEESNGDAGKHQRYVALADELTRHSFAAA